MHSHNSHFALEQTEALEVGNFSNAAQYVSKVGLNPGKLMPESLIYHYAVVLTRDLCSEETR